MRYPIHIAFCVSDNYVQYICVTIKSIIENHKDKDVTIHVLSDVLSDKSILRLNRTIGKDSSHIHLQIHYVDDTPLQGLKLGRWTKYAWYRLLLPSILSDIHYVLYLDADTIVCGRILDLFAAEKNDFSIKGVLDNQNIIGQNNMIFIEVSKYINSGVLLINLDYWRENKITNRIIEWACGNSHLLQFPDQDAINYICRDSKLLLPLIYNVQMDEFSNPFFIKYFKVELKDAILNPKIIHYCGSKYSLPFYHECGNPHLFIWNKYNKMVPYRIKRKFLTKGLRKFKFYLWNKIYSREKYNYYKIKFYKFLNDKSEIENSYILLK